MYNNKRWRKRRALQLAKTPICEHCSKRGSIVVATVADHIEPHRGDPLKFWTGKLQSLCHDCHVSYKAKLELGSLRLGCGADGTPLSPRHHWNNSGAMQHRGD